MKYIGVITAAVAFGAIIATPAFAGSAAQNSEWQMKQKACKSEASARGLHLSKKTAYVKECMARMAKS
ncbi:hypothetical protein [Bradyrhizobium sp. DOA9]|uniref:hypothetical protein n=1 Tax=Bradyrhizobium sp. DOA9 TaxID=1126627 RepID=UPI0004696B11|nr:hypothetical protein [Bradyrhizobium sp. DOA9]GAJ33035.1 hypothetical protein BDOA9_0122300 [Bradyrhizobium sp. DOA9]